jgi:hypothetical protein
MISSYKVCTIPEQNVDVSELKENARGQITCAVDGYSI